VAAVFTNGLVRIVRTLDAMLMKEFYLNLNPDSKVVEAKISSKSYLPKAGAIWPEKVISVGISYKIEQPSGSQFRAQVFSMKFENIQQYPLNEMTNTDVSDSIDLGNQIVVQDTGCHTTTDEITSLYYNN
jgi:hypothetical protein